MSILSLLKKAKIASRELDTIPVTVINSILRKVAKEIILQQKIVLAANAKDLQEMNPGNALYERARLTPKKLASVAKQLRAVAAFSSPVGSILEKHTHPNGMKFKKISVPIGVIGVIYESRPTVTLEVFSLCLKSGNVGVLKGGSEVARSNKVLIKIIHQVFLDFKINPATVTLLPPTRSAVKELVEARNLVDLLIPRGGRGLIDFVRQNSRIPVIETGAGICHIYFDASGDLKKGTSIVTNSKVSRPFVCNSLDVLLVHKSRLQDLPELLSGLLADKVTVRADRDSFVSLQGNYPTEFLCRARQEDFATEFLSLQLAVKTVDSLEKALAEITRVNGNHSESIISENKKNIAVFLKYVDAAAVYANAPTVFTDGGEFGLGAEIGISTQKLHARGPVGLRELVSYKWVVQGNGQIRK